MAKKPIEFTGNILFYQHQSKLRWGVVIVAGLITVASVYYTNNLVSQLKEREKSLIELYANTLEYTANDMSDSPLNLFFLQQVIIPNNSIPVILMDEYGTPVEYRNVRMRKQTNQEAKVDFLKKEAESMEKEYEPILITLRNNNGEITGYRYIYYKNSFLLTQLQFYPVVQLSIIAIFGLIAYLAFSYSKAAEQNKVWIGLAKETAHQLGTPLSSLMAWTEYFKSDPDFKDKGIIAELDKDIQKLEMITNRFSSIGSVPVLKSEDVVACISEAISYLQKRVSTKVHFKLSSFPENSIHAKINKPLFDWVIENICKNAVDSMGGVGTISIKVLKANEGQVLVDISDTGKGIPRSKINSIFQPGFTTKKRGWGLGLTLAQRIIDHYHQGKIFVKKSEVDKGTTFRLQLKS